MSEPKSKAAPAKPAPPKAPASPAKVDPKLKH